MLDVPRLRMLLIIATVAAVGWLGWTFAKRYLDTGAWVRRIEQPRDARAREIDRTYSGSDVKILNFYARDAVSFEDGHTILCYSVLNAKSLRIDPPVEGVFPSLSHCVEVSPQKDTRYTLMAEGNDGRTVSASFVLPVRPDPEKLPKIPTFKIQGERVVNGRKVYTLFFWVENAEEVSIDPPLLPPSHVRLGHLSASPVKTTTYTLTATGKHGRKAQKQLTIVVPTEARGIQ